MADDNQINVGMSVDLSQLSAGLQQASSMIGSSMQQAVSAMGDAMSKSASVVGDATSKMADSAKSAGDKVQGAMEKARSAISGTADAGPIKKALDSVGQAADQAKKHLEGLKEAAGAFGLAIVGYMTGAIKASMDFQKSTTAMAKATGMSTEEAAKFAYAAKRTGVSMEDFSGSMMILSRNVVSAQKEMDKGTSVFSKYGIQITGTNGKLLSSDQILKNVAEKYKSMPAGIERNAMAMAIFGRSAQNMVPLLNQGAAGIDKMGEQAKAAGIILADNSAQTAYIQASKDMNAALDGLQLQMGNIFMPVVTALANAITNAVDAFNSMDPVVRQIIVQVTAGVGVVTAFAFGWSVVAKLLSDLGGPFATVIGWLGKINAGISICIQWCQGLIVKLWTMHAAWLAGLGPVGWVIGVLELVGIAIATLYVAWTNNFGGIVGATEGYLNGIISGLQQFWSGVQGWASGIVSIFAHLAEAIKAALVGDFVGAFDAAKGAIASYGAAFISMGSALAGAGHAAVSAVQFVGAAIPALTNGIGQSMTGLYNKIFTRPKAPTVPTGPNPGDEGTDPPGTGQNPGAGTHPGGTGKPGGTSKPKTGDSEFEKALKKYDEEIQQANYSATEKEAIYKRYLENVKKSDKEAIQYKIGLHRLETDALQESLKERETDLELSILKGEKTEAEGIQERARLKRQAYEAEVDFEVKARMDIMKLSNEEQAAQYSKIRAQVEGTQKYKEALKGVLEEEKKLRDYQRDLEKIAIEQAIEHQNALLNIEKDRISRQKEMGLITAEEAIQLQKQITEQEQAEEEKRLNLQYKYAKEGTKEHAEYLKAKQALDDKYAREYEKLQYQLYQENHKWQTKFVDDIEQSMTDITKSVLKGTSSLKDAFRSFGGAILDSIIGIFAQMIAQQIVANTKIGMVNKQAAAQTVAVKRAEQTAVSAVQAQGNAAEIAQTQQKVETEKSIEEAGKTAKTASAQVGAQASLQASATATGGILGMLTSVATALASIPWYGWVGIAMLSGIGRAGNAVSEATGQGINLGRSPDTYYQTPGNVGTTAQISGTIASAAGGWKVPYDQLMQVHKDEVILPKRLSDGFEQIISNGGNGGSGVVFSPQISISAKAIDNRGMKQALRSASKDMVKTLQVAYREFKGGKV